MSWCRQQIPVYLHPTFEKNVKRVIERFKEKFGTHLVLIESKSLFSSPAEDIQIYMFYFSFLIMQYNKLYLGEVVEFA